MSFDLQLEVGTDFADIISVKEHDFSLGDPEKARALPPAADIRVGDGNQLVLAENGAGNARTQVIFSRPGEREGGKVTFPVELDPRERWELRIDVITSLSGEESAPMGVEQRFGDERERVRDSLHAWRLNVPRLRTSRVSLYHAFEQSVADLAALRMRTGDSVGRLPAAGMPWFMTVFGRDTIITSLQSMLLGPELALAALRRARRAPGHGGGSGDRRRAGQDHPRAPARAGGRDVVPVLLRHRRRDAALPRPALGGVALDGRRRRRSSA